jgi:3-isopropylmalate/(R)-2-methylmalate dehydratase large subunit
MLKQLPYTYQILSRCQGAQVCKGESILCDVDRRIIYAWPGFPDYFAEVIDKDLGGNIAKRDEIYVVLDHMCPPRDQAQCDYLDLIRNWCRQKELVYVEGEGIGHYLAIEKEWVKPGMLVTHFDAHVASVGAIGALGIGMAIEMLVSLVTAKMWIDVPPLYRIDLKGKLTPGVMGRDLLHYIVALLGTVAYNGAVIEFYCEEDTGLTLDDKMVICNLINQLGAMSALFVPPDELVADNMHYEEVYSIDLNSLEPYIGCPPSTNLTQPLTVHSGKKIDLALVGTCSGGGINDIATAAKILRGKRIKDNVRFYVCPSTNNVFVKAMDLGYIKDLVEAGAFISSPTCDYCYGRAVYLQKGHRAISTQTLNVPGRLGSSDSEIYLASPAAVAAAAVTGTISDPRIYCF